jgi:hypothetical protein
VPQRSNRYLFDLEAFETGIRAAAAAFLDRAGEIGQKPRLSFARTREARRIF